MSAVTSLMARLFGATSRLSALEKMVLNCVRAKLNASEAELWDRQVNAINKVQRLPGGVEVNFYRMKKGRPSFDPDIALPNKSTELLVANVRIELEGQGQLNAKVWCVKGFVFMIEYEGSVRYFEEAAGMDPCPKFTLRCELKGDLALAERGGC
jgi:hypothetical protein